MVRPTERSGRKTEPEKRSGFISTPELTYPQGGTTPDRGQAGDRTSSSKATATKVSLTPTPDHTALESAAVVARGTDGGPRKGHPPSSVTATCVSSVCKKSFTFRLCAFLYKTSKFRSRKSRAPTLNWPQGLRMCLSRRRRSCSTDGKIAQGATYCGHIPT